MYYITDECLINSLYLYVVSKSSAQGVKCKQLTS